MAKDNIEEPCMPEENPGAVESGEAGSLKDKSDDGAGLSEPESVECLKGKVQSYLDQLVRLQAEFANYRKRTEKEKLDAIRFGRETIIERMISLVDVMDEAIKHSQNATDVASLKKGFEMVAQEFVRVLKSEGAEPLKTVGEKFDPHLHEAVEQEQTDNEEENNLILREIQKGYMLHGRLLRPAKVKVAKAQAGKNGMNSEGKLKKE